MKYLFSGLVAERIGLGDFFSGLQKLVERCLFSQMQRYPSCSPSAVATALWNTFGFGFAHENKGEIWERVKSAGFKIIASIDMFLQEMGQLLFWLTVWHISG